MWGTYYKMAVVSKCMVDPIIWRLFCYSKVYFVLCQKNYVPKWLKIVYIASFWGTSLEVNFPCQAWLCYVNKWEKVVIIYFAEMPTIWNQGPLQHWRVVVWCYYRVCRRKAESVCPSTIPVRVGLWLMLCSACHCGFIPLMRCSCKI